MNHLADELRRFVAEQISTGRYASEGAVLADMLRRLRADERFARSRPSFEDVPLWGLFQAEPELIDRACGAAMRERRAEQLPAVRGE